MGRGGRLDFLQTGDADPLALDPGVLSGTQMRCIDATSQLVNFTNCSRVAPDLTPIPGFVDSARDIVDWPQSARDGYVFGDVNTVVNAYTVGSLQSLSRLWDALGRDGGRLLRHQLLVFVALLFYQGLLF